MSESRKEQLFDMLFDILNELTEHESPELIFDRIVDDFASTVEYHTTQADTFKSMLDTFRHELPQDFVPDVPGDVMEDIDLSTQPSVDDLYGGMNDINRQYMLEDRDNLMEFLKNMHFPDKLDS